ncbi:uncharacterized protein CEXT_70311, partial [Caerostris extrusa]
KYSSKEDSTSSVKTFTERLSSFRKTEKTYVESSSVSTDDSADSSTPLNKSLPLLQRVRLFGAQEKKSEMLALSAQAKLEEIKIPPTDQQVEVSTFRGPGNLFSLVYEISNSSLDATASEVADATRPAVRGHVDKYATRTIPRSQGQ